MRAGKVRHSAAMALGDTDASVTSEVSTREQHADSMAWTSASTGCDLSTLWVRLEARLPLGAVTSLSGALQQLVWAALLQRPDDLHLLQPARSDQADPSTSAAAAGSTGGKGKGKGGRQQAPGGGPAPVRVTAPPPDTWQAAQAAGMLLAPSADFLSLALGLYDSSECRFQMNPVMMDVLERAARARWAGIIVADVASAMRIQPRNFFYIVKQLEERGLVVKNPLVVQRSGGKAASTSNLLHLARFAPAVRLGPQQSFRLVTTQRGQELQPDVATYCVQDDAQWLRLICERVGATAEKVVMEAELKKVLGFSRAKGHRQWRRLRRKLLDAGFVDVFQATVGDRVATCVRLLKPFNEAVAAGAAERARRGNDDEEEGEGEEDREQPGGRTRNVIVEVPIQRQVLEAVLQAGRAGVLNVDLIKELHLDHKKFARQADDFVKRYGLTVKVETVGRQVCNRLCAPEALLQAYEASGAAALRPAAAVAAATAPPTAAQAQAQQRQQLPAPVAAGAAAVHAAPPTRVLLPAFRSDTLVTALAESRMQRVYEELQKNDIMIQYELKSFFMRCARLTMCRVDGWRGVGPRASHSYCRRVLPLPLLMLLLCTYFAAFCHII